MNENEFEMLQEKMQCFRMEIEEVIDRHKHNLTPKNVIETLVFTSCYLALDCAPTHKKAVEYILQLIEEVCKIYKEGEQERRND